MQQPEETTLSTDAAQTTPQGQVGPFTQEQLEEAKQAYEHLRALFASTITVNTGSNAPVTGNHKTMGDVGDKTLDMLHEGAGYLMDKMGEAAGQIAATTQKAAPVVWGIMVKQQVANGLANIIGPIVTLVAAWIFHLIIFAAYGEVTNTQFIPWKVGLGQVAPIVFGIIGTVWLISALTESLQRLVNPQYFAARDLIDMITRRR